MSFFVSSVFARRSLRLAAGLGVVLGASATMIAQSPAQPLFTFPAPALGLTAAAEPAYSSSTDSGSLDQNAPVTVATATPHFDFMNAMQYGGGRRGRPRYRGGNTNADGSSKYSFVAGAGFTQPIGNTYHYLTPSYGIQVGGGRNWSKQFGMELEFNYDHFGFNGRTLGNQLNLYNNITTAFNNANPGADIPLLTSLDGSTHVWSFTLNPRYTLYSGEGMGAYLIGGVGFYHKVATFTTPETALAQDGYGDVYEVEENGLVDHYSSNAPGFDGGFGLTYKFSHFSNERLYGEVKYVYVLNSQRQGLTVNSTINGTSYAIANDFPANSNRTSYIPVKFGLRF